MTTMVPVVGVKRYRDRHGKWRCYHRKTGKPIKAAWGTPEFLIELKGLNDGVKTKVPTPGTFGALMTAYKATWPTRDLADATKAGYQRFSRSRR